LETVIFSGNPESESLLEDEAERQNFGYGALKNNSNNATTSAPRLRFSTRSIRRGFIRKVFAILALQLGVVTGLVALFVFQPDCKRFVQTSPWFYILSYVIFVISYFAMALGQSVRRRFPGNIACLALLTISMGYMMGSIAAFHSVKELVIALIITVVACLLVVAFTLQPKYHFMGCLAITYAATSTFFVFGIVALIATLVFYQPIIYMIYCGLAAILFMMYLSIDVYLIVGGKRPEISPEDYTFAATQVFLDIVNIFLLILILVDRR